MFFKTPKQARIQASIDNVALSKIKKKHIVEPCKIFTNHNNNFGRDYIKGYTLVLVDL